MCLEGKPWARRSTAVMILVLILLGLSCTVLISIGQQTEAEIDLEKGLVAYWKFDEGEGDIAFDQTENHNDGTLESYTNDCPHPNRVKGKFGLALEFERECNLVTVPAHASLHATDELTIAAWVNPTAWALEQANKVVCYTKASYGLEITFNKIRFFVTIEEDTVDLFSNGTLSPNTWHYIAGVYDGSEYCLYLDGNSDRQMHREGKIDVITRPLDIGGHSSHSGFSGLIDEVRIYNRALTEEEIKELYEQS